MFIMTEKVPAFERDYMDASASGHTTIPGNPKIHGRLGMIAAFTAAALFSVSGCKSEKGNTGNQAPTEARVIISAEPEKDKAIGEIISEVDKSRRSQQMVMRKLMDESCENPRLYGKSTAQCITYYRERSDQLMKIDKLNEALEYDDKILQLDPDNVEAKVDKITLLLLLGRNDEAKKLQAELR